MPSNKPLETYGYSPSNFQKFKKYAWLTLLSFGLTYMFFYNGRQNINLVMPQMEAEFQTNKGILGIVGSSLFWCYAFGQLVSGQIGARFGYKRVMTLGVIASAILNVIISFQSNLWVIAVLWGMNGFFQAMVWSNGLGVINNWWPKNKRGFASGLTTAFSGLAQAVTYLTISWCVAMHPEWGWRAGFRLPILPMVLILIPFLLFFKETPKKVGLAPFQEPDQEAAQQENARNQELAKHGFFYPYKLLFREPRVILFCLISAIAGIGRYGLLTWIPSYFASLGFTLKNDMFTYIVLPLGQACAMFAFPLITDRVFKGKREPMLILASIVAFACLICFPMFTSKLPATIMLFVVGVFSMVTGVIWAIAGDMGGKALSSTVVGVLDWAVYMGAAVQSLVFGFMQKAFGWSAVFITIGCLYILLLGLTLVARKVKLKHL